MSNLKLIEKNKNFNGFQCVYSHYSKSNKCEMRFSIYLPNTNKKLPVLYFLSGLMYPVTKSMQTPNHNEQSN